MKVTTLVQGVKNAVNNKALQVGVLLTASGSALATGSPSVNEAAITAAVETGKSMVQLTTSGVIGIAALCFGLGMVVAWLRR